MPETEAPTVPTTQEIRTAIKARLQVIRVEARELEVALRRLGPDYYQRRKES